MNFDGYLKIFFLKLILKKVMKKTCWNYYFFSLVCKMKITIFFLIFKNKKNVTKIKPTFKKYEL